MVQLWVQSARVAWPLASAVNRDQTPRRDQVPQNAQQAEIGDPPNDEVAPDVPRPSTQQATEPPRGPESTNTRKIHEG